MGEAVRCGQGFREAPVMVWVCILLVLNQHSKASIQCCSVVAPYVYLEEENTLFCWVFESHEAAFSSGGMLPCDTDIPVPKDYPRPGSVPNL